MLAKQLAQKEGLREQSTDDDDNGQTAGDDHINEDSGDEDMQDVRDDPEAGFAPTEDQPYRRLRRHTIT